jgi:dephospho-CoA kinase
MCPPDAPATGLPSARRAVVTWVVTGGVACGKSTVMQLLREALGGQMASFSCDEAVHQLYEEPAVVAKIRLAMGDELSAEAGQGIDRRRLGERVFADPAARAALEGILHPAVLERLEAARQAVTEVGAVNLFVAEVPLYYEIGRTVDADHVIVVASSSDLQVQRLMQNRGLTQGGSEAMLASQWPVLGKVAEASKVIWNDGSAEALADQVAVLLSSFDLT